MKHYIIVDGGYYINYRVHALMRWWKFRNPDITDDDLKHIHENEEFVNKFKKMFIQKIDEIPKKLKLDKDDEVIMFIAQEGDHDKIWRHRYNAMYKYTRKRGPINMSEFYEMVSENNYQADLQCEKVILFKHENLEADDVLAIMVECIRNGEKKTKDYHIHLFASDTDYFQIHKDDLTQYTMNYKIVRNEKNSYMHPGKDKLYKILRGDKSDNIPPVFDKFPNKKAKYYVEHNEELLELLKNDNYKQLQFMSNTLMIDFKHIPTQLKDSVIDIIFENYFPYHHILLRMQQGRMCEVSPSVVSYLYREVFKIHEIFKMPSIKEMEKIYTISEINTVAKAYFDHRTGEDGPVECEDCEKNCLFDFTDYIEAKHDIGNNDSNEHS